MGLNSEEQDTWTDSINKILDRGKNLKAENARLRELLKETLCYVNANDSYFRPDNLDSDKLHAKIEAALKGDRK